MFRLYCVCSIFLVRTSLCRLATCARHEQSLRYAPWTDRFLCFPAAGAVQALWSGHASLLVQMGGVTFLTDPVLSERCSAVQVRTFYGFKGVRAEG